MRIGGLISDWLGEIRLAEPEVFENGFFGTSRLVRWKAGRFELGYPLGMPLGVDAGVAFQVYTSGAYCCATTEPLVLLPVVDDALNWFEIVGVATHLQTRDQSNVIERSLGRRVTLAWPASASDDVAGYRVYHDDRSGTVDYETVVDEVDANPGGLARDDYAWTSDELAAGTWRFGIRAADAAGNVKTAPVREVELTLTPPPDPPADLAHDYHDVTHTVTLSWSAPERWT
ncbi:MAG TPA: hypothetical protein VMX57_02730 [Planctomycetota bacterium]|nr:hypothetical protein [Planctomycetota bacterium]